MKLHQRRFHETIALLRSKQRLSVAARVIHSLETRRRIWITETTPAYWLATSRGIVLYFLESVSVP